MKQTPENIAAFERSLLAMAEAHRQAMKGMSPHSATRYVRKIVDSNALVFGVFPDPDDPRGYNTHIIKGKREIAAVAASNEHNIIPLWGNELRTGAVPCDSLEQAVAAEQTIGDGVRNSH